MNRLPRPDPDAIEPQRPRGARQVALTLAGVVLLLLWGWWWIESLRAGRLALAERTRIPAWRFLGLDFLHNYNAVRLWLDGGNPYTDDFGDFRKEYAYPPVVLPLYAWCRLVGPEVAVAAWMGVIAVIVAAGAWAARQVRVACNLAPLPLVFIIAAALCSMPVLFAMERGQGDALVLLMILITAWALRHRPTWAADLVAGGCLALAAWIKVYPLVLLLVPLALRRNRAAAVAAVLIVLIGVVPYGATQQWLASARAAQGDRIGFLAEIGQWMTNPEHRPARLSLFPSLSADAHSLTTYWAAFWERLGTRRVAHMPGILGAALVLAPLALWVMLRVRRSPASEQLAYPLLLLLAALATFAMPVSYDYNLIYLPLAALAVCDRRDPLLVAAAIVGMLAWWQPFKVPWEMQVASMYAVLDAHPPLRPFELLLRIERDVLFFLKLFAAAGVAMSLVLRARQAAPLVAAPPQGASVAA